MTQAAPLAAKQIDSASLQSLLPSGTNLQAKSTKFADNKWYSAEVVSVSPASKRSKAPVKVHWLGYSTDCDEWVSRDCLRSKALTSGGKTSASSESLTIVVTLYSKKFTVKAKPTDTVLDLKTKLHDKGSNILVMRQSLTFRSMRLGEDSKSLSAYGIKDKCTLQLHDLMD